MTPKKKVSLNNPAYLLKLGEREGSKIAKNLAERNQDLLAAGHRLTPFQIDELVNITLQNLRIKGDLSGTLSRDRLQAFIDPFLDEIRKAGLF